MSFDIEASARVVQEALRALEAADGEAVFFSVEIATPEHPVGVGPSATIAGESMKVVSLTLTNAIELHVLKVTLWRAQNSIGEEARELEAMRIASQVMDLFYGDFQLGGNIRAIDVGGIHSGGLEVSFEPREIENAPYHIADITLPLIVDSATALAA